MTVDRHQHVEPVMGTVVSFDVHDRTPAHDAVRAACAWLHEADATFSTYRPDSAISRIDRGELLVLDAGADVAEVLAACATLARESHGAFDVRAGGRLEPAAYVKGWAAERAAGILVAHGLRNFQINAGGDVVARGDGGSPGSGWRIGIRHPVRSDRFAAVVRLQDAAIATSARYERGDHIVSACPADEVASVSVVAADLGRADGWATALWAAGPDRLALLNGRTDVEAMVVVGDTITTTENFPAVA